MNRRLIEEQLESIIDRLADIEHKRWAHWQSYLHEKAEKMPDGSLLIPAILAERWERQIATAYQELNEEEKESDREQVRQYFPIIAHALSGD